MENYKNLLFPKQENYYQFLFPIGKIGKANGHPDEKVPSHYLGNEFGDSPSQFSHQHGERTEVLSMDRQVTLLQHPPLASWPFPYCINPLFGHDRHMTSSRPSSLADFHQMVLHPCIGTILQKLKQKLSEPSAIYTLLCFAKQHF